MKVPGLNHLAVVVSDLARAEGFYSGVLGLAVTRRLDDDFGRPRALWLDLGDGLFLALERAGVVGPRRNDHAPGWHCVALDIAPREREAWRRRLESAGHPVERETPYTLYVRDPDGSWVALSHWPDAAPVD
jgi:hypothetical protein